MTALRLYLSAQTPQSGTSGMPTTKISGREQPDEREPIGLGHAHLAEVGRRNEKTWLTPRPSTIDVSQKTTTIRSPVVAPVAIAIAGIAPSPASDWAAGVRRRHGREA